MIPLDPILGLAALFLLLFATLIYYHTSRLRNGYKPQFRPIRGYELITGLTGRAIETERTLHLSLGVGSLDNHTTADTLAGLAILEYLAKKAAVTGVSPTVSMADPMAMLYAQNTMRVAHGDNPDSAEEAYRQIRWVAPQPTAYAAGVMNLTNLDNTEANVMVGNFGEEYLLMGEAANRQQSAHIGGTSNPNALAYVYASAEEALMGEEIYAAGAYLSQRRSHQASLMAQDAMRWFIVCAIFVGVLMSSLR